MKTKRFHWSKLYPKAWRDQFGEEFDAMLQHLERTIGVHDGADIVFNAGKEHLKAWISFLPFFMVWVGIGLLNVIAKEVQWSAGMLLLCCMIASLRSPRAWLKHSLLFALVIPISSLYFYQIPNIHHEPLYKTAVALIPAFVGSLIGVSIKAIPNASIA